MRPVAERFVVVGLARSRSRWFGELARWATAGAAPVDFVKCLTAEEARAVVGAGRAASVLLVDAELPRFDRDLVAEADRSGVPTILVGAADVRDWEALGCAARLDPDFGREELVEALERHARRVAPEDHRAARVELTDEVARGTLIGVIGPGGAGTSTIAMALAQAVAAEGADTVLVDGCRRSDLAMYHDVGDVIPGFPELVDLHRSDEPDPDEVRALEFPTPRGYRLVLGMRRPRDWAGLRPRAVEAAFDGLRRTHEAVVVDLEGDLETEAETGSSDIEDRHAAALAVVRSCDAMVVVSRCDMKGTHDAVRLVHDVGRIGAPAGRLVVAVNLAPRSPVLRSRIARTIRSLTAGAEPGEVTFAGRIRSADAMHRDVTSLPGGCDVLQAIRSLGSVPQVAREHTPVQVRAGELGAHLVLDDGGAR